MMKQKIKPRWRGLFHQEAFFVSVGACAMLIARSSNSKMLLATIVYSIGLLLLFGISAIYHRPHWEPRQRALMKRLDHSSIFIFIAGTMTPIVLLGLPDQAARSLLLVIWLVALAGIAQSIFWVKAPPWVTAGLYIIAGWLIYPSLPQLRQTLTEADIGLLMAGGIIYTIGAIFYALKKPTLWAQTFGYHELFHVMTIVAAAMHFIVIYSLIH